MLAHHLRLTVRIGPQLRKGRLDVGQHGGIRRRRRNPPETTARARGLSCASHSAMDPVMEYPKATYSSTPRWLNRLQVRSNRRCAITRPVALAAPEAARARDDHGVVARQASEIQGRPREVAPRDPHGRARPVNLVTDRQPLGLEHRHAGSIRHRPTGDLRPGRLLGQLPLSACGVGRSWRLLGEAPVERGVTSGTLGRPVGVYPLVGKDRGEVGVGEAVMPSPAVRAQPRSG